MKKESILIIGGTGFLGGHLALRATRYYYNVLATYNTTEAKKIPGVKWLKMDITNRDNVQTIINKFSPGVIIHTAAITNVGTCARCREKARLVNIGGTENVASTARKSGCRLIFISTDFVFQGDKGSYSEKDNPHPLSLYGKTKLIAEASVMSLASNICIARVSLLYGFSVNESTCFTDVIIFRLTNGKTVDLFVDEIRTPIYVKNLCKILIEFANRRDLQGIYHLGGPERMSRLQFGWKLCKTFGLNRRLIQPIKMRMYISKGTRPKDCSLNSVKATKELTTRIWTIDDGLADMKSFKQLKRSLKYQRI